MKEDREPAVTKL